MSHYRLSDAPVTEKENLRRHEKAKRRMA